MCMAAVAKRGTTERLGPVSAFKGRTEPLTLGTMQTPQMVKCVSGGLEPNNYLHGTIISIQRKTSRQELLTRTDSFRCLLPPAWASRWRCDHAKCITHSEFHRQLLAQAFF